MSFRGMEMNAAIQWLKRESKLSFVEWCPTGFKCEFCGDVAESIDDDNAGTVDILAKPGYKVLLF